MELRQTFLVVADISGYTRFVQEHRMSLIHAEKIITDLLESVIDSAEYPLTLNKLEGDAALFHARSDGTQRAARDVWRQVLLFFQAFGRTQTTLLASTTCTCRACSALDQLRLKAILHHGKVLLKRIKRFEELAGEDVILVHRLLKNSVPQREYVLMTRAFHDLAEGPEGEHRTESYPDLGSVPVVAIYPGPAFAVPELVKPPPAPAWRRIARGLALQSYYALRILGLRRGPDRGTTAAV